MIERCQMITLSEYFDELLAAIEPVEDRLKFAEEVPAQLRAYLKESDMVLTIEPHSRLAGSYARQTAISNCSGVSPKRKKWAIK